MIRIDRPRALAALLAQKAQMTALLAALLAAAPSGAQQRPADPAAPDPAPAPEAYLDLDTGGHRAVIRALAASETRIWSAGDDKVIREWNAITGAPGMILRGQIGPGNEGTINALALSADGGQLAAAGYFAPHLAVGESFGDVRIFDTASGKIRHVLKGFDGVVDTLAYDPQTDVLAVSGQGGRVQLWRAPFSGAPERLGDLDTMSGRVMALALMDGVLAAASFDYGLRMFALPTGAEITPEAGEPLWEIPLLALAVAPDGERFALAGADGTLQIRARSGALLAELPKAPFRPDALAWSGAQLTVGCGYRCAPGTGTLIYADPGQAGSSWELIGSSDAISPVRASAVLPGRDATALAGGRPPEVLLTAAGEGEALLRLAGSGLPVSAVAISADGGRIAWGSADPCPERAICPEVMAPLGFAMQLPSGDLSASPPRALSAPPSDLGRALLEAGGYSLASASAQGSSFEGSALVVTGPPGTLELPRSALDGYYISAFGLIAERAEVIAGGGNGVLLAHTLEDGRVTGEFIGHTADVLALAVAPEANRMVTGGADQTLRIWNLETRQLIATLFVAGPEWILWTPEGYFHSSPGGDRLIGWHLNQGRDNAARFITAREMRQHLHSPEIVRRALLTGDAPGAAIELRGTDSELASLLTRPAPEFEMRLREDLVAEPGTAVLELTGSSLEEMESWGFSILVNDRRVPATRISKPLPLDRLPPMGVQDPPLVGDAAPGFFYSIPLEPGENEVLVSGEDEFGYVTERSGRALFRAPADAPAPGKLYVAVVGVNRYPDLPDCGGKSCELAFPVNDAIGFLRTVQTHTAPLFSGIETLVIATPEDLEAAGATGVVDPADVIAPEGRAITDALIDFLARPGPEDTTIIFIASHGINIGEDFFIVPGDAQMRGGEFRKSSLVDWSVIQEEIGFATGRRILMLDTCHAANAFNARLEKDAADARVIVFSATAANNTAQERRNLGHGIFTWSVIEGLSGGAAVSSEVRLLGLADYIYREVIRLSDGRQEPFYHISQTSNFLLARQ